MRALSLAAVLAVAAPSAADDYVVLETAGAGAAFHAAATKLAARHAATVLTVDPAAPEKLLPELRRLAPRNVALVMAPGEIEFGFQRRFLDMASRLDDDPFVDFAFGYVTGATGEEAAAFVDASLAAAKAPRAAVLGVLGGGASSSRELVSPYRLRNSDVPVVRAQVEGDENRIDHEFVARVLPKLAACNAIEFAGHGFPDRVVGGLDASDVAGLRLPGAVVLNVACWTGVTSGWYDDAGGTTERKEVASERSLALAILRTGVAGYTAYLCPRPMGPELDRDLMSLVVDGDSLGDARRRDYDKTVLGFLGFGEERMSLAPPVTGTKTRADVDAIRDIMLEDATGGIVFGDPALRSFAAQPGQEPVEVRIERGPASIVVSAACRRESLWLHCAEPTARIGGESAMKVYTRVLLGDLEVADVVVDSVKFGARDAASRVVWAVEDDHGERFAHVKVVFPRQTDVGPDEHLAIRFTVRGAAAGAVGHRSGGTVEAPIRTRRGGGTGSVATAVDDAIRAAAATRRVSDRALEAALAASSTLLGKGPEDLSERQAIRALGRFGSEGYRAVCALIETGNAHSRTHELLEATYQPGDEKHLLALADRALPNHAGWIVLDALGATGSAPARKYLIARLAKEEDPGLFMCAAKGLARLEERAAAEPVGERLLRFSKSWSGVEKQLVDVLGEVGGSEALSTLKRYADDPRARQADVARAWIKKLK